MSTRIRSVSLQRGMLGRFAEGVLCLIVAFWGGTLHADTPLVSKGAVWKYLDNGSNQGTNWRALSFNDNNWKSGPAQLGYGDGDEATVVSYGNKASNKYITTYFRRAFNVEDPAAFESLKLWLQRDDGAVVYLNGVEVLRSNMPTGTIGYTTRAPVAVDEADEIVSTSISPSNLVAGANLIAVEIHQASPTSSDIGLDLSLDGVIATPSTVVVPAGSIWKYLDNGSDQGTQWRNVSFDDSAWQEGPAELGYGDGGERTVVGSGPSTDKYITTYFRRTFDVSDPSLYAALRLRLMRDDGAVVYLNGTEVHRANMPSGDITSTTPALVAIGGADESTYYESTIPTLLVSGTNILAVEIHQDQGTSSDISFDLEMLGLLEAPDISITRGPYLQNATSTSMVIRWRTDTATTSKVWIGETPATLVETDEVPALTTEHEVEVTGLEPDKQYYYAVGSGLGQIAAGSEYSFFTPPIPGTRQPFRIWVLGDSGTADANATAVKNAYKTFNASQYTDMWLMLGDNAYTDGTDAQFQAAVFDMYPEFLRQSPLWSTLGNHEYYTAQGTPYFDLHTFPTQGEAGGVPSGTEKFYSFDYGNVHFICLDSMSSDRSSTGPMANWLRQDLESTTQDWIIAFFHHPPYTKGSHNSDNPTGSDRELLEMREGILPILEAGGVDLVLGGHSHSYERSYLIDGHYGLSTTFSESMKKAPGNGRDVNGTGAYSKPVGLSSNQGAVYAVAGSSGKATNWWGGSKDLVNPAPHPAMVVSLLRLGSMILDVDGSRLDVKFLNSTGAVEDEFTLKKELPNTPPAVTITSPTANSTVNAPVKIAVDATDGSDTEAGSVVQVDFYANNQAIGSVEQPVAVGGKFEFTWVNPPAGSHTLTATAWDDAGASTTSAPVTIEVNGPPTVLLTSPLPNSSYEASESVTITASATDSSGGVQQVAFFANGVLIAQDSAAPYEVVWNDMAAGSYQLTAVASDTLGATATSAAVSVTITAPNLPPSVTLTSPVSGASYAAQATITLSATAEDEGDISRVEFYANGVLVGTVDAAPYLLEWADVAPGNYTITATAFDDRELQATSNSAAVVVNPNVLPSVTLTSPEAGSEYTAPATVQLAATATDADGEVTKVEFYAQTEAGDTLSLGAGIKNTQSGQWEFTWDSASQGIYTLSAVVTDSQGGNATSGLGVPITVNPPPNEAPTVSITSPATNTEFVAPAAFDISATAADDGNVVSVSFAWRKDGAVEPVALGTDTESPFSVSVGDVQPGVYDIVAVATDNQGQSTTSAIVRVTVVANIAPTVALTVPNTTFTAPADIALSATAADEDGTVASVAFYNGTQLLGTDQAAPFGYTWSGVEAGTYTITAVAKDDRGASTTSSAVLITVQVDPLPAAPTGLTANVSKNRIDLTWTDNATNETGFLIEERIQGTATWREIGQVGANVRLYRDAEFAKQTTYEYRVRAVNAAGSSGDSNVAIATTMR